MEKEAAQFGVTPFSYDILDQEAAKISSLISAVNQKLAASQADEVARELFQWAEQMREENRLAEAEFLYLHAINVWERHYKLGYPILFKSLRDYAMLFMSQSDAKLADNVAILPTVLESAA
jgi:hypothetical protein